MKEQKNISSFFSGLAKLFSADGWIAKVFAFLLLVSGLALLDYWFSFIGVDFGFWLDELKSFFKQINFW